MGSFVSKHCSGRNYNSPLRQGKSVGGDVSVNKEERSLNPSLRASVGNFSTGATGSINPNGSRFDAGISYNKGGFSAGVGVSGMSGEKPNITAKVGFNKKF
jgi:hypothetical protein